MKQSLFALTLGLQLVDVATMLYAIKREARETNQLLLKVGDWFGNPQTALLVMKLAFAALIAWQYEAIQVWGFVVICAFYVWITVNNVKVIRRLKENGNA